MSVKRINKDATEWAIITKNGLVKRYPFDQYGNQKGRKEWGQLRTNAYEVALKHFLVWAEQPCMQNLDIELIEQ
jgi:hypothetical protein